MQRRANAGTRDIGTINSNKRIAATVYSLGTLFVSGIYVQIPCIKEIMTIIIIIIIIIIIHSFKSKDSNLFSTVLFRKGNYIYMS
jgi:uncharacterized membrane protein